MSSDSEFPSQASLVRRTDVALRARYPFLSTRIFETEKNRFEIVFDAGLLDATTTVEEFNRQIRPAGTAIHLSNRPPSSYLREIPRIEDAELSRGFEGYSLTGADIGNILLSRHPDLPELVRLPNQNNPIVLLFERALTQNEKGRVDAFMAGHLPGWPFEVGVATEADAAAERSSQRPGEIDIDVRPSRLRPQAPPFVREDEAFWFENVDALFEGRYHPNRFAATADAGTACYVAATSFPQIDIRQAVLVYDTVYLTPPLVDIPGGAADFWQQQTVTREDVLRLIEVGRLRLVLGQPEERTDTRFLAAAHERNPTAVIGRLQAAAIMISDIVATADEYSLGKPELGPVVRELASRIEQETGMPSAIVSRLLLWPLHARRSCLAPLMQRGLMGIGPFSAGGVFAEQYEAATGRDVTLEALATSDAVHVAHALNATLIPPTQEMEGWLAPRRLIGDRLNFYRSFNSRIAAAWAVNERRKEARVGILPPVPLFSFHPRAKIDDLVAATSFGSVRRKGRAVMTRLCDLPPEERAAEIDRLAQEVYDLGGRRERRNLIVDSLSDGIDVVGLISSASIWPLKAMWNLLNGSLDLARRAPALDGFIDAIEQDLREQFGRNADLDFLSKVSRVAELREDASQTDIDMANE